MARPLFRIAPRLFPAVLFFGGALSLVGRAVHAQQQQQAYFSYQTEQLPLTPQARHRGLGGPVFFAAAFSVPIGSHVAGHVGGLQPVSTFCEKGSILRSFHRSLSGGSASKACAADQLRLVKQNPWMVRASSPTSAGLSDSTAPPTPTLRHTHALLASDDMSSHIFPDLSTAISAGAGGLMSSPPAESTVASEWPPAVDESSPVTLSALPSQVATGEKPASADAALHAAVSEAEAPDSFKSSTTTAATARERESEKIPSAAPLGPVVTRKDLVASLTAELQLPRGDVERTIAALLRHITANLEVGRKVSISKFGSFNVRRRKERIARNPRTGEALNVAAATFPTFSFSKVLKERVRDVVPVLGEEENEEEAEEKNEGPLQSDKKGKPLFPWS